MLLLPGERSWRHDRRTRFAPRHRSNSPTGPPHFSRTGKLKGKQTGIQDDYPRPQILISVTAWATLDTLGSDVVPCE